MEPRDSGITSGPLGLFCARLKRLQVASGINQSRLVSAAHLGKSQMSDILNGKIRRLPDWGVIIVMVRACLEYAEAKGSPVPPDLRDEGDWRRRYADLEHDLDAETRPRPRRKLLPGRLLAEVIDPFALEVHRPVQPDTLQPGLPTLPAYLSREHDVELEQVVSAAARGDSGIAALVGGSSTGKTRACWEALRLLRDQPEAWRLWHPIDPSRPEAALREVHSIGSHTVIWLNEAQFYLDVVNGDLGERVAAGLREVLRDPARAPVLVLATLWPQYWDALTVRPAVGADPHAQARELLAGQDISVAAAFTATQLRQVHTLEDPRLVRAAESAEEGQVIQFLAGAPELMARYRNAPSAAAALINAAMDARRLGMKVALPLAFLEAAAPGYLTDIDWEGAGEDWLEQALAYAAAPCTGIRGPLARIRLRPLRSDDAARGPTYRLADYLDQYARQARRRCIPPSDFWNAARQVAEREDLSALADAAAARGLLRSAARLRKRAASQGSAKAAGNLVSLMHSLHPADQRPARWAVAHTPLDDPYTVALLLATLEGKGMLEQSKALFARDPAAHISLKSAEAVSLFLSVLVIAGGGEQVNALLARDPAAHTSVEEPWNVHSLLRTLQSVGAGEQAKALADRVAAHTAVSDPAGVGIVLDALQEVGAEEQIGVLLARAPASHVSLDNPAAVRFLQKSLRRAGAEAQAKALLDRLATHTSLDDPAGVAALLGALLEADAVEQVTALLARDPAEHASLGNPAGVAALLNWLRGVGVEEQVTALLARDPAEHASLGDPAGVAALLGALSEADAVEQVTALLARDPAGHAFLNANVSLTDELSGAAALLKALREAGAEEQASALVAILPVEGMFGLFCKEIDHQEQYRFGREPDGSPSAPWGWVDLDD